MIALIDGDVLCYHSCPARWDPNKQKVTEYDSQGRKVLPKYTREQDRAYLELCWKNFNKILLEMLDAVYAEDFLMAVKGPENFRDAMYPIELNEDKTKAIWGYKANRWKPEGLSNVFVPVLRKLAVAEDIAIDSHGREADDLLRIWSNQAKAAGVQSVVCSVDKDLNCIPGKHFDMKKKELFNVSEEQALRFYYEQLLKGDSVDNIPGVPGLGPVKATNLLKNLTTEAQFQECVVEQYLIAYGEDDWKSLLLANGKMIYLQSEINDYFTISNWPIVKELS